MCCEYLNGYKIKIMNAHWISMKYIIMELSTTSFLFSLSFCPSIFFSIYQLSIPHSLSSPSSLSFSPHPSLSLSLTLLLSLSSSLSFIVLAMFRLSSLLSQLASFLVPSVPPQKHVLFLIPHTLVQTKWPFLFSKYRHFNGINKFKPSILLNRMRWVGGRKKAV